MIVPFHHFETIYNKIRASYDLTVTQRDKKICMVNRLLQSTKKKHKQCITYSLFDFCKLIPAPKPWQNWTQYKKKKPKSQGQSFSVHCHNNWIAAFSTEIADHQPKFKLTIHLVYCPFLKILRKEIQSNIHSLNIIWVITNNKLPVMSSHQKATQKLSKAHNK